MRAATRFRPTPPMRRCSRRWSDRRPSPERGSGTRPSRPAVHWAACDACSPSPRSPRSPAASGWRSTGSGRSPPRGTGTPRTRAACRSSATGSPPPARACRATCPLCVASNRALGALAGTGAALAAWGLYESQWVQGRELEIGVPGLPAALDGLSVLHLSDFHAGTPSLNVRAMRKAAALGAEWQPDLVALTGDILSHGRARDAVVAAMEGLRPPLGTFAVLGNHDVGDTNDPFSRGIVIEDWGSAAVTVLRDSAAVVESGGHEIEIAGVDPGLFSE